MSALARVCDTFAEHVQGLGRTSLAGIAAIWKIHSFSTVAPRTPVSINHLSKMHKDPLNPLKWHTKISSFLQSHMCFRYRRRIEEALHRSCCEVDRVNGTLCRDGIAGCVFPHHFHVAEKISMLAYGLYPPWVSRTRSTYQAPHMEPRMGSHIRC